MSDQRTPVLIHVNQQVQVPGFAEPFMSRDMRFRPVDNSLLINAPGGVVRFTEEDAHLTVKVLDLDVPTVLRAMQVDNGWEAMTMGQFVTKLHLTYLSEV